MVAVIQARMGSTRFPEKMMANLNGRPMLEWVISRLTRCSLIDEVILAIPEEQRSKELRRIGEKLCVSIFEGPELDVLERVRQALEGKTFDAFVRVCADNPFVCPDEVANLIREFKKSRADYAYNHIPRNNLYPDGFGAEIVSKNAFKKILAQADGANQREHCFNYIWQNLGEFSIHTFDPPNEKMHHPELRFDVDTVADIENLRSLDVSISMSGIDIVEAKLNDRQ